MKSTFATSVLRRSPSPAHCLQPSCHLVWSNSCYLIQNCTISTMQILLHSGRHDWMRRSWEFGECKFIFIAINPPFVNLNILMMGASFRFICLASCMVLHQVGQIILHSANTSHELFMWPLLLLKHRTTQQSTQFVDCCIMPICHYEKWKCIRFCKQSCSRRRSVATQEHKGSSADVLVQQLCASTGSRPAAYG